MNHQDDEPTAKLFTRSMNIESSENSKTGSVKEISSVKSRKIQPRELQQLWFSVLRHEWSTLAIVPSHAEGSSQDIAEALVDIGTAYAAGAAVKLINAQGLDLKDASMVLNSIAAHKASHGKIIVALDPVVKSLAGIPLAQSMDAVILTVSLQEADIDSAQRTVQLIGKERIIGCVTLHPRGNA